MQFQKGKACIPFLCAGDPDLQTTKELLLELQRAGADVIEIGVPFSDPIAEGLTLQAANERALHAGCSIDHLFEALLDCKDKLYIPLLLYTYVNPIFTYGKKDFMKKCKQCGIEGLFVPDLPYEEKEELKTVCEQYDITLIDSVTFFSQGRIQKLVADAKGYINCVFTTEVKKKDLLSMLSSIQAYSDLPCVMELDAIASDEFHDIIACVDGLVLRDSIVERIEAHGKECIPYVCALVKDIKEAFKG